jgi:hypothetical protein
VRRCGRDASVAYAEEEVAVHARHQDAVASVKRHPALTRNRQLSVPALADEPSDPYSFTYDPQNQHDAATTR